MITLLTAAEASESARAFLAAAVVTPEVFELRPDYCVLVMAAEGPSAIAVVRATVGATRPNEAAPGSIRADFGLMVGRNLIHSSDGPDTARDELALWFAAGELADYTRDVDRWILE